MAKSLYFVTFRTEEGLPFVPTEAMNEIIWGALARGQELYPVKLCGFSWMPNHPHCLVMPEDPESLSKFIGYVKQETAHAINRLLGRRKRTIWSEGFDSPVVLDSEKALELFAYALLNPVKDNLVGSLDDYPGVSSWRFFKNKLFQRTCYRINRDTIPVLEDPTKPHLENKRVLRILKKENGRRIPFSISPYAWKHCFSDTAELPDEKIHEMMMDRIKQKESKIKKENTKSPIGKHKLVTQSILKPYQSKTFGKRMICLSSFVELRKRFISYYKYLCTKAIEVFHKWKLGKTLVPFPSGMFPPCLPRTSNLLPNLLAN